MTKTPEVKAEPQSADPPEPKPLELEDRPDPQPTQPPAPKPIEVKDRLLPIVALHDNALIGQVTFAAGTVLAHVIPIPGVTLEQLCSAIIHAKAGPGVTLEQLCSAILDGKAGALPGA